MTRRATKAFAMKTLSVVLFSLVVVGAGCVASRQVAGSWGRAQHGYPEDVLGLRLAQDVSSWDLILTLTNQSSYPITNFFSQTVFEGSIWVLQEGTVPLRTFPSNYFALCTKAFWGNPETAIPACGSLTYRVPLDSLICPFSSRGPDGTRPVTAYAFMDGLEAVSNLIPLKHQESIQWRTIGLTQ